ncbi:hypothetical protein [Actinoalloteichus caeruleus]|uniref:hypothetical protein n=1 Tax=Actinoalloteichus cyanogriseus TaxID=2893586 RepID=UPI0004AAF4E3|nr:hypothetical protein [Actinoalloteichus caeruleus]
MREYEYEYEDEDEDDCADEDDDEEFAHINHYSGDVTNVVQARDIHGDVNYYERDHGVFHYRIFRYAGATLFLTLFVTAAAYSHLVNDMRLTWWEWALLPVVTAGLVLVMFHTHSWIYPNPSFRSFRAFLAIALIALGYNYGPQLDVVGDVSPVLAHWIVLRF